MLIITAAIASSTYIIFVLDFPLYVPTRRMSRVWQIALIRLTFRFSNLTIKASCFFSISILCISEITIQSLYPMGRVELIIKLLQQPCSHTSSVDLIYTVLYVVECLGILWYFRHTFGPQWYSTAAQSQVQNPLSQVIYTVSIYYNQWG